jgi:biopolymer transport protein ExbD
MVFNLLIFFALSLNFIVTPGIKVDLPESVTEEIIREEKEIIIVMKKDNSIFINSNPVSFDRLFLNLNNYAMQNKDALVVIQADREVTHGKVVKMMDMAKRAGLVRLAISTSMTKTTGPEEK